MTFGEKLKLLRKINKISQKELAKNISSSQALISNYESDEVIPKNRVINKITSYFGVSSDYFDDCFNIEKKADYIEMDAEEIAITLGKNLKKLRKSKKLTQLELSEATNITTKSISLYETGKRLPEFDTIIKFCNFFKVNINVLLTNLTPNDKSTELYLSLVEILHTNNIIVDIKNNGNSLDLIVELIEEFFNISNKFKSYSKKS